MTDFALSSLAGIRPFRCPWGAFPIRTINPISTATIYNGNIVTLNYTGSTSAGQVIPVTAGTGFFYTVGVSSEKFVFTSSGVASSAVAVWEANPNCEFRAVTQGAVLASSNIGLRKKIMWDSTLNIHFIDLTASTATDWRCVITGLIDAEGDSGGAVSFRFLTHTTEQINSSVPSTQPLLAFYS